LFHKSKDVFLIVLFQEAVEEKSKNSPFRKVKPIAGVQLFGPLASLSGPGDRKRYMLSTISLKNENKQRKTYTNNNKYKDKAPKSLIEYIYRTLKVGNGDGVSILGLLNTGSLLLFFTTETES
jgi:hypothetical protein